MQDFKTLIKFGVTGLGATGIHMLVVFVLIGQWAWDVGLSNGIAFIIATLFSNYVNTLWSFQSTMTKTVVVRFWTVSVFGCSLAILISKLIEAAGYHYVIGVLAIAMTVPIISFSLHRAWTYKVTPESTSSDTVSSNNTHNS